jgi:hypothetical protein
MKFSSGLLLVFFFCICSSEDVAKLKDFLIYPVPGVYGE